MSERVLSTPQAKASIIQVKSILNGGLRDSINHLNKEGATLSDPNVWDGMLAGKFRSDVWPQCRQALQNTLKQLEDLQMKIDRINQEIQSAGGN